MFTKIIVGIDGKDGGRDALALARILGPDAELIALHAFPWDPRPGRGGVAGHEELMRNDALAMLHEVAGTDGAICAHAVADLSPARALHREAQREDADLIIIGSCHRGVLGRVFLGDVSRGTVHGSSCPVAIAPQGYRDRPRPVHVIGVGVTSSPEALAGVRFAGELAQSIAGRLWLLTAVQGPKAFVPTFAYSVDWTEIEDRQREQAEKQLAELVKELDAPVSTEVAVGTPGYELQRLSTEVDLIVAGSRGWGAAQSVVLGSTTDRLAHHAACPVILVPGPVGVADHGGQAVAASAEAP